VPAVVDGYVVAAYGGVDGLEVAVEEEGVEGAGWGGFLAEGEEVDGWGGGGAGGESGGGGVGVEGGAGVT